jgi:predicted nuclease of predicted toxin-antitoxin system
MLKFIVDHNVPFKVVRWLREECYEVLSVGELDPQMPDREIAKLAEHEKAILLTNDRDYLELTFFFPNFSLVIFAFLDQGTAVRITALEKILPQLKNLKEGTILILK